MVRQEVQLKISFLTIYGEIQRKIMLGRETVCNLDPLYQCYCDDLKFFGQTGLGKQCRPRLGSTMPFCLHLFDELRYDKTMHQILVISAIFPGVRFFFK